MQPLGLLIDIDGVLTISGKPIEGAVEAFRKVQASGVPYRLATNTTTRTRASLAEILRSAGFDIRADEILTAPVATAAYLREHHPGAACFVLSSGDLGDHFADVRIVPASEPADVVVLGGAGLVYTHQQLNRAFELLLGGAAFVAMHRNLYWRTANGLELDTGAYVTALEAAVGRSPVVVGKPSPAFFAAGVSALGVTAADCLMIGDDIVNDVLGAQDAGLRGCLVMTGKYRPEAVVEAGRDPDVTLESFRDVPALLH